MSSMWLKLILLLIYVSILFILARVLETVTWVESGNFSRRLLDPMTMSVLKLKALLEQRGISYEGAVEKRELTELVEGSGVVSEEDVLESTLEENIEVTNFTGGAHFLEQVEDCKDSVWLVQVQTAGPHRLSYITDTSWYTLRKKLTRFGVNTGVFDCQLDQQFCINKGWHSSRLILGLPQDFRKQSVVTLYTYSGHYKSQNVFNWIRHIVSTKVYTIGNHGQFQRDWVKYKENVSNAEVRMIMFTKTDTTPLFFSALSVKFPGRVRFGKFKVDTEDKTKVLKDFNPNKLPLYVVRTAEDLYVYGYRTGEHFTFRSLEIFLKMLYPSLNDIFVFSLVVCNLLSLFEPFLTQGSILKRIAYLILCTVKYNMTLLLTWISLLTLFQLSVLNILVELGLKLIRTIGGSIIGTYMRQDTRFYLDNLLVTELSFVFYLTLIGCVVYRYKYHLADDTNPNEWNFAQFRTLQHLFYPTAVIAHNMSRPRFYHDPEETRENLEFFHSSQIQDDYIHSLPTWSYKILAPLNTLGPPVKPEIQRNKENISSTGLSEHGQSNSSTPLQEQPSEEHEISCLSDAGEAKMDGNKMPDVTLTGTEFDHFDSAKGQGDCQPDGMLLDSQCVICLDEYATGVILCGLPCGHCFHKQCVVAWLLRDNHFCPVCRQPSDQPKSTMHLHSE